jgi:7,8-dihydropterin-6-yl-methyl-4-(beta-D-ribofuranosyl)aminobenzene 5'-phosphate synthase
MLYKKGVRQKDGVREIGQLPMLQEFESLGGIPVLHSEPKVIADGKLLLCGEIPRKTSFEKGFPGHIALKDGSWVDDSLIIDDRCLVGNVKGKGLVVISGCSHAGIINMLNESMRLSGCESIHAVLGGLHLIGRDNKSKTAKTIKELKVINPKMLAPGHCTGWKAIHAISQELPKSFTGLSVGNRYVF